QYGHEPWPSVATSMKTRGWLLHSGIFGFGQNTTPGPDMSFAVTSTTAFGWALILRRSYRGQPLGVLRIAAVDDVEERALDLGCDRSACAFAQRDAVVFADRRHLGRGAGEERLVGDVDLVAGDALLDDLEAEVRADREDGVARDAVQRPGR